MGTFKRGLAIKLDDWNRLGSQIASKFEGTFNIRHGYNCVVLVYSADAWQNDLFEEKDPVDELRAFLRSNRAMIYEHWNDDPVFYELQIATSAPAHIPGWAGELISELNNIKSFVGQDIHSIADISHYVTKSARRTSVVTVKILQDVHRIPEDEEMMKKSTAGYIESFTELMVKEYNKTRPFAFMKIKAVTHD